MDNNEKLDLKIKINRGRYNLIFLVITSVINIFTISSGSNLVLPYSSAISNYAVAFGTGGNTTLRLLGLVLACAVLLLIMICYLLSKTKPMYLVIAFSIVIADTLALLVISFSTQNIGNLFNVLDLLIHVLIVIYLLNAIKAYNRLQSLGEELMTVSETPYHEEAINEEISDSVQEEEEEETDANEENGKPIREYEDDGTAPLVSGKFSGLEIFAIIRNGKAELVINGYVCDELEIVYMNEFQLRAIVNDIDIIFDYKRTYNGDAMYLYADDELLDSLGRS